MPDAASPETYWARFYDAQTGRPILPGAQDAIVHPTYHDMAANNMVAYDFLTTKPGDLFEKEVPRWKRRGECAGQGAGGPVRLLPSGATSQSS